jgi:hypothetical protein
MVHVQAAHMLNIYQLGSLKGSDEESRLSPHQCDDEDKASVSTNYIILTIISNILFEILKRNVHDGL